MILTRVLPRLPPTTVERPRLERWLATHASVPVRLLIAPAGSGKTTLLLKYMRGSAGDVAYCALPPGCIASHFFEAIGLALGLPRVPPTYSDLIGALRSGFTQDCEILIDDADNLVAGSVSYLQRLLEDAPENISFVFAGRSRDALDAKRWIARGLGVLCDFPRLAFDASETQLLAEACRVSAAHADVTRLLEESDGWAVVVCGAIRCAAEDGHSLGSAYDRWRARYGQLFAEFIAAELDHADEEDRAIVRSIMSGALPDEEEQIERLEAQGLFVVRESNAFRPLRALRQIRGGVRTAQAANPAPLSIKMFGHFQAQLAGSEIPWVRKRDQQIVKYLLLKPSASASRSELASIFWPDADRQLAAQSVRTACSNIRKAIAAIVGYSAVDRYFRADPDVALELSNVVADLRRFSAHVVDGDAAFDRGDLDEAAARYRAAEELYSGRLLDADAPEPWFTAQGQLLEDRYIIVLERLAQLAFDEGDMKSAADYAYRVQQRRPDSVGLVKMLGKVAPQYRTTSLEDHRRRKTDSG